MKTNRGTTAAIGVGAILLTLFALAPIAGADVVYTRVNVTISGNGSINLDLNQDGINDFVLHSSSRLTVCGLRGGLFGSSSLTPTASDGVVISYSNFAALLASGVSIDSSSTFRMAKAVVTQFHICSLGSEQAAGYLGLEFQINGQTHYGWAQVSIHAFFSGLAGSVTTTVVDFAYETNPGQAIKTGQISSIYDNARGVLDAIRPGDFGCDSPVASVPDNPLAESLALNAVFPAVDLRVRSPWRKWSVGTLCR